MYIRLSTKYATNTNGTNKNICHVIAIMKKKNADITE